MVNGISFNGRYPNIGQYSQDFENVAKYTLGTTIVNGEDSPFQGMGLMVGIAALPELWKGATWLRRASKHEIPKDYFKGLTEEEIKFAKQMADPFSNGGWKKAETYKEASENIKKSWAKGVKEVQDGYKGFGKNLREFGIKGVWNNYSAKTVLESIPDEEKFAKLAQGAKNPEKIKEAKLLYDRAKQAANLAKENPVHARKLIDIADHSLAKANALSYAEKLEKPATGFFGKIGRFFGKLTGFNKANSALKGLATESPTLSKVLKFGKGNGWFAAISGAIELFTQVIPSFTQLGAGSGMKQLGKSTAKVGASVGGWVGGMAVGAAIGSVLPGAGTVIGGAIGAICGIIGGCLGSWGATKLTEEIVGKDELELAKEKQAKLLAEEASKNPETAQQLLMAANEKLQAEGNESEDAKVAFGSLTRLSQGLPTNNQTQYAQNNPNFTGTESKENKQTTNANPFKFNPNAYSQPDFLEKDFMAMNAGLV